MAIDGDDGQRIKINTGGTGIAGIQPARSPGTPNYSGLAGAWDQAAAGADAVFDIAAKALRSKRQQQAKTEGAKYGSRRKGGQAVPLTGLDGLDPNTVYGQQFIASATQAYGESVGLDARAKAYELQAQHAGDPEGFAASYGAFADESLAGLDEDTRAVVEPEFQAQMRLGHARLMRDKIVQARQDTVETLNQSFEAMNDEVLGLIAAGQGDDPRVAELTQQMETHFDAAVGENLIPESARAAVLESAKDARTQEAVYAQLRPVIENNDFDTAYDMIGDLREEGVELGLSPDQVRTMQNTMKSMVAQAENRDMAERRRAITPTPEQTATYQNMVLRAADPAQPSPSADEVRVALDQGELHPSQAGRLFSSIGAEQEANQAEFRQTRSAKWRAAFEMGQIDYSQTRDLDLTDADRLAVQKAQHERLMKRIDVSNEIRVDQAVQKWESAAKRNALPGPLMSYEAKMWEAADKQVITSEQARGHIDRVRKALRKAQGDAETLRNAQAAHHAGNVRKSAHKNALIEQHGYDLQTQDPEWIANNLRQGDWLPSHIKDGLMAAGSGELGTTRKQLELFDAIRRGPDGATGPNSKGATMLRRELGKQYRRLENLAELVSIKGGWQDDDAFAEAVETWNKAGGDNASYDRRLKAELNADTPQEARDSLLDLAKQEIRGTSMGSGLGTLERVHNFLSLNPISTFGERDPGFLKDAETLGVDVNDIEVPEVLAHEAVRHAEYLIGSGEVENKHTALRHGFRETMKIWGPEMNGDEVRWTRRPILREANEQDMAAGFRVGQKELHQDFAYKMRLAGKEPPPGYDSWDALEGHLRFDAIEGGEEWDVFYRNAEYGSQWEPLAYRDQATGEQAQVSYAYRWTRNNQPNSLHHVLLNLTMRGDAPMSGSVAAARSIGWDWLTQTIAQGHVETIIEAYRQQRESDRFWTDPDTQAFLEYGWSTADNITDGVRSLRDTLEMQLKTQEEAYRGTMPEAQ